MKLLHWEKGGFLLYCKRLESGTFIPPNVKNGELSWSDLILMVEGIQVIKSIQKRRFSLPKNGLKIGIKVSFEYLYGMETALENLSKEDLLKVISSRDQALVEEMKR